MIRYESVSGDNRDFISLCEELDRHLNMIVGDETQRLQYMPHNKLDDIRDVILAYDGDIPAACASFKDIGSKTAEIKRVFVKPEYRGRGISTEMMSLLESIAVRKGFEFLVLETGRMLTAAFSLYKKLGFHVTPNYGPYTDLPQSVCMKKEL